MDTKQKCVKCDCEKDFDLFIRSKNVCKDCDNATRRLKYQTDDEHRKKLIQQAINYKKNKAIEKNKQKLVEQEKIGIENKICRYCDTIKHNTRFRHNRLKCRDCERDEPTEKFKRYVRTRIYNCLKNLKEKSSIEYLGCSTKEYINWIIMYDERYTMDNYGSVWHIDHVIPISRFNLEQPDEQLIAFNWRNTMPLSAKENLAKSNRIIKSQIIRHVELLKKYHHDNNIVLPEKIDSLFATYLDAGNPLEPLTTTS